MYVFEVASRHMSWLASRQAVTASNIANADTPGYRTRDVEPFSVVLDGSSLTLAATSPMHLKLSDQDAATGNREAAGIWDSAHAGNNVSLERELMAASATSRMMSLDTSLERSFHRMLLSSVKV